MGRFISNFHKYYGGTQIWKQIKTKREKSKSFSPLGWLDPRTDKINQAGVAFYNEDYGEYYLKIDEEPREKQYYLKPVALEQSEKVFYRMELVVKNKRGKFIKRQCVGEGFSEASVGANVHIDYGSKFKTLILFLDKGNMQNDEY